MAEGAPLLREYRLIPYRGFESLSLRQIALFVYKSDRYEPKVNLIERIIRARALRLEANTGPPKGTMQGYR